MLKLLGKEPEVILAAEKMGLGELFEIAQQFGKVEIGSIWGQNAVEINLNFVGEDYVSVKSRHKPTLEQNLAHCIEKARTLKGVY